MALPPSCAAALPASNATAAQTIPAMFILSSNTAADDHGAEVVGKLRILWKRAAAKNGLLRSARNHVAPEFCYQHLTLCKRRAQGGRAPDAPDSRVCNGSGSTHTR